MQNKSRKIGIIGIGHVGAHVAYTLALQGVADELVLVDIDEKKAASEEHDLLDSVSYFPHRVRITTGSPEDLGDCDVIINSSGRISLLLGSEDRTRELKFTIPAVRSWAPGVKKSGFQGVFINISNPCDVVTREIAKQLDLPEGRVFGTGTGLDSARLVARIAERTGVSHSSISAYMLGEHGNAQFAAWSCVSLNGMPLDELRAADPRFDFDRSEVQTEAVKSGWITFSGKNCTEYAIAATAARMAACVLNDEKRIMPASMMLHGEYGEKDLFIGVPCVIGRGGAERVIELPLTEEERATFHDCAEHIRANMALADSLK